jgi:Fur family ferric uptake transcriptional regulator
MTKRCKHSPLSDESAKKILSERGINKTSTKVKILIEISRSKHPLAVAEIYHSLREECNVSTVFRAIAQFKEKNIVEEVNLDEGFFRYELNHRHQGHHHHHHVRCRECGDIQSIENCDLNTFTKAILQMGFREVEHRLEFIGLCSDCR